MSEWKVLLTDGLEENGKQILAGSSQVLDNPTISTEELLQVVGQYDALIVRGRTKVTKAVFDAGKNLKIVGRCGVGVDNIDLVAAKEHKVVVVNAPIATTIAVAELTMGLMLSVVREIPRADSGMKSSKWLKKELEGTELYRKTLGVIGFGRIGTAVAARAAAFGMKIIGYSQEPDKSMIGQRGGESVELDELYARSDVITIHTSMNSESRGMINRETIAKMKRGVYIICAARGGIIDETALLAALDTGHVAGAGLDVFATEPPGSIPLVNHPKVIATPHIGAQSVEAQQRAADDIATEILAGLRGDPLRWQVA